MLFFDARKTSQGFTLIEILIILFIVGTLSAISAPNFIGLLNRGKVNDAVAQARGALQEAQREAIRKSKNCTVIVPAGSDVTLTSPNNCLVTGKRTLTGISIRRNNSFGTITFDFKGRITAGGSNEEAIVFSPKNVTASERCLMISKPLGLIRTGIYSDTLHNRTTVAPNDLATDPNCKIIR